MRTTGKSYPSARIVKRYLDGALAAAYQIAETGNKPKPGQIWNLLLESDEQELRRVAETMKYDYQKSTVLKMIRQRTAVVRAGAVVVESASRTLLTRVRLELLKAGRPDLIDSIDSERIQAVVERGKGAVEPVMFYGRVNGTRVGEEGDEVLALALACLHKVPLIAVDKTFREREAIRALPKMDEEW
jgi:hypothetical protein